ncbi:MAG: ABC transporter substrate-binding protein [Nitrospiraceae bacterium]|nr:ABC transporter substrate-binding protein [Nitrospiraceae bacterium]
MKSFRPFFYVAVLLAAVVAPACSPGSRSAGYIVYRLNADPTTLDPAYIVDVTGGSIAAKLFNGLVRLDKELHVIPDIAGSWEIRDGGRTYVFHLKKHISFSNGRAVTAADFRYSFERVLSPEGRCPNTWVLDKIAGSDEFRQGSAGHVDGIGVTDPQTLVLRLKEPFAPFLQLLTMTAAYVVPEEEVKRRGPDFSSSPVGTGPFTLQEWRHNTEVVLKRNTAYFGDKAHVKGIRYRIIPEDLTAVTEFELGNIDVISVPAYEYSRYRMSGAWKNLMASLHGLNTYYLGFNCSRPPFDDPEVRRAVARAIDREKILRTFYEGRGRLASGPVPDLLRSWAAPVASPYDPAGARRTIEKKGLSGRVVHFYVNADPEVVDIAEIIQSYLKAAGLRVKIRQLEWSAYKMAVNSGEADIFWLSWWADYPDPENFLFPLFHSSNHGASGNRSRYTNPEVDRLIVEGQKTVDVRERNSLYREAEYRIVNDMPWVFFWHKTDFTVRQPTLKHYLIYPIYSIDKGTEVSF